MRGILLVLGGTSDPVVDTPHAPHASFPRLPVAPGFPPETRPGHRRHRRHWQGEIQRLSAAELSDGTLRFFCLCAALLTPKPPPLMVFNEPQASLHPSLVPPLADLIAKGSADTQIVIVTHSRELAAEIADKCEARVVDLASHKGETRPAAHAGMKRVWTFEGE